MEMKKEGDEGKGWASRPLHMSGGTNQGSFHNFSKGLQNGVNEFFRPRLKQAITRAAQSSDLLKVSALLNNGAAPAGGKEYHNASCIVINIADFGCSSAWSTINSMQFIANCIHGHVNTISSNSTNCTSTLAPANPPPGYPQLYIQAFFNDTPSNDFNTLFTLLSSSTCSAPLNPSTGLVYIPCGLPGSFYSRLLPPHSLHVGLSTLSLSYLSSVPEAVQDRNSAAWNEGRIWIFEGCKTETALAYKQQFENDFSTFLLHRGEELVPGGLVFCVMLASVLHGQCRVPDHNKIYFNLEIAWQQLVAEGVLEKDSLDTFNLPFFAPTMDEVKEVVRGLEESFQVIEAECVEVDRAPPHVWEKNAAADSHTWGSTCVTMVRNFMGSVIQHHLGLANFEVLLERYRQLNAADDSVYRTSRMHLIVLALSRR